MKILLIEDEKDLLEVTRDYLLKEGYEVVTAATGIEALNKFRAEPFEFVVMDLMLPDLHGEELCRLFRETSDVPIIMLTAKSSLEDKINGLALGADDYITKPFSLRELIMRIKSISKRVYKQATNESLAFDHNRIIIDRNAHVVLKNNAEVYLTKIEFDILMVFAENPNRTFTREQLIEITMGYDYIGYDRTIDTHIKNIRKKIEDDLKDPRYIKTVYGVGYKFISKDSRGDPCPK
ncbi:response regulator transcription factor [Fusibacter sp. 3D3]|uniref:response regulator transcription factor n=1 Tax=Fusibacter sp. 3D3 TaxID=1048380 RepID=UPI00085337F8|nr:response regulator transcription factor [Fusibacter sp. 3D3]GAU79747.1 two-component response regulator [Fusibacter sp. 3D3]